MNKEPYARSICKTLREQGYIAYYAGGFVRDQLLEIHSEDIDIATDAPPEKIQALFPKTIPLGIAFGIVMVVIEHESFEVATFRKDLKYKDGRRPEEVVFSSPEEDAKRRDFTINGMFYDPLEKKLFDYVGGEADLKKKVIRAIGDPFLRFEEDKLRLVRACRFAARFGASIEQQTKKAILAESAHLMQSVSIERITQELKKMASYDFKRALELLFEFGLLQEIFPSLSSVTYETLQSYLSSFSSMPKEAPMVLYLMELFPKSTLEDKIQLLEFLKVSNEEIKLATFCQRGKELISKEATLQEWVHFYAHPSSEICLKVLAASLFDEKKVKFLEENKARALKLQVHVERKKTNTPLVTAAHLMKYGIESGPKMGNLLNMAEEITIEHDFESAQDTLKILQKTPIWKTS